MGIGCYSVKHRYRLSHNYTDDTVGPSAPIRPILHYRDSLKPKTRTTANSAVT
jgi:hypothetical protein